LFCLFLSKKYLLLHTHEQLYVAHFLVPSHKRHTKTKLRCVPRLLYVTGKNTINFVTKYLLVSHRHTPQTVLGIRPSLFCNVTQHALMITCRSLGANYRSHLPETSKFLVCLTHKNWTDIQSRNFTDFFLSSRIKQFIGLLIP